MHLLYRTGSRAMSVHAWSGNPVEPGSWCHARRLAIGPAQRKVADLSLGFPHAPELLDGAPQ
jgi:hypothetical protein